MYPLTIIIIIPFVLFANISLGQIDNRPRDVKGWADTHWGMSETEIRKNAAGEIQDVSAEFMSHADWNGSPVIPMFRLPEIRIGEGNYQVDFLLSRNDEKLYGVAIVCTTNDVDIQTKQFEDLREKLILKYGRSDNRAEWMQSMTETDEIYDHQVVWYFKSTVILLQWREMKTGYVQNAVKEDLKIEYIDPVFYRRHADDLDKL